MFSSSDTFVPPLHACRHVPSNAQKASTALGQLFCPHALPASCSDYFTLSLQTNQSPFYRGSGSCESRWDRPGSLESQRTPAVPYQLHLQPVVSSSTCNAVTVHVTPALPLLWGRYLGASHFLTSVHMVISLVLQISISAFIFPSRLSFPAPLCICLSGFAQTQGR